MSPRTFHVENRGLLSIFDNKWKIDGLRENQYGHTNRVTPVWMRGLISEYAHRAKRTRILADTPNNDMWN